MKKLHFQKLAEENVILEGQFTLVELERVRDLALNDSETGKYLLKFYLNSAGEVALDGNIEVNVSLVCQRCATTYTQHLNLTIDDFTADDYEGSVDLEQFIEDEILLGVPIIPRHEIDDCNVAPSSSIMANGASAEDGKDEKPNPFRVLKQLINR